MPAPSNTLIVEGSFGLTIYSKNLFQLGYLLQFPIVSFKSGNRGNLENRYILLPFLSGLYV